MSDSMLIKIPKIEEEQAIKIIEKIEQNIGKKRGEMDIEDMKNDKALQMTVSRFYTFKPPDFDSSRLRYRVFIEANNKYGGYIPLSERDNFIAALSQQGIDEKMLWIDSEENHTLDRIRKPTARELCDFYNILD